MSIPMCEVVFGNREMSASQGNVSAASMSGYGETPADSKRLRRVESWAGSVTIVFVVGSSNMEISVGFEEDCLRVGSKAVSML